MAYAPTNPRHGSPLRGDAYVLPSDAVCPVRSIPFRVWFDLSGRARDCSNTVRETLPSGGTHVRRSSLDSDIAARHRTLFLSTACALRGTRMCPTNLGDIHSRFVAEFVNLSDRCSLPRAARREQGGKTVPILCTAARGKCTCGEATNPRGGASIGVTNTKCWIRHRRGF